MHEEIESKHIPLADCKDRQLYRINSRNLTYGVFDAATGGFNGLRTKFGSTYVFMEYHWDKGPPYGTVRPVEALPDALPAYIENCASFEGSTCSACKKDLEYIRMPWTRVGRDGEPREVPGYWRHVGETERAHADTDDFHAYVKDNPALYHWLVLVTKKYELYAENAELRFQLANSPLPCVYCKLPADDMAQCARGFPGCGRADDLLNAPERE